MPGVTGKKKYQIYLTESEVEYLRVRLEYKSPGSGGFSALIDDYVCKVAKTLRESGNRPGERMTWKKVVHLLEGCACDSR